MEFIDKSVTKGKLVLERARARWGLVDIVVRTFKRFGDDDGGSLAAALTYYTFFSIFPLLLASAAILGYLTLGNTELRNDILDAGIDAFPMIKDLLEPAALATIESRRGALALTAFALAIYTGSGAIVALEHALNKINRVREEPNWFVKRFRSLRWMLIFGAAAIASVALGAIGNFAGALFGSGETAETAGNTLAFLIGIGGGWVVGFLMFSAAYKLLPNTELGWRQVVPGAIVAAVAFELLKYVGSWYLERGSGAREATFGVFAAAAGLLVASYIIAQITLLSAELNLVLKERRALRGGPGGTKEER